MTTQTIHYHSYLLRVWRDHETSPWRIQLEDPHSGERRGFSSLDKMVEFLTHQMEEVPPKTNDQ